MRTKAAVRTKKQAVTLKDLKTKKNPRGGVYLPKVVPPRAPGIALISTKDG